MVEPVNIQQVLAGSMIAGDVKGKSKDKKLDDENAFSDELQKVEKLKQSQIHDTKEAETENRIKENEEQKEEQRNKQSKPEKKEEEPEKQEQDILNDVPQPANPDLLAESDHEIDLEA